MVSETTQATTTNHREPIYAAVAEHDGMKYAAFDAEYADIDALHYWKTTMSVVEKLETEMFGLPFFADVVAYIEQNDDVEKVEIGHITHDGDTIKAVGWSNPFKGYGELVDVDRDTLNGGD